MAAKKKSPAKKKPAFKKKPSAGTKSKSSKKPAAGGAKRKPATSGRKTSGGKSAAGKKGAVRPVRKSKRPAPKRKVVAPKSKVNKGPRVVLAEAPEALALARSIAAVALEKKAENVLIVDTRSRSEAVGYDYVVLASGESDRQLSAIHEGVDLLLKPQGKRAASVEASPDWVCVNYDEGVVAHFFTPDKRDMMDLEDMWKDAPRVSL